MISASALVGGRGTRERVENDFYSTPFSATRLILNAERLEGSILEPAAGQGHISRILKEYYPDNEIVSTDLVKREDKWNVGIVDGIDFLTYDFGRKFDNIVTNPPFRLAKEFVERSLQLANKKVVFLCKLSFLESEKRYDLFSVTPPLYVYVHVNRVQTSRNGEELNEKGKPWASTMAFAWFVWDKEKQDKETTVRWLI